MKPEELFDLADQIQESASGYKTMEAWLLHMEEYGEQLKQQVQNRGERDLDCVALMTMHSSKGLEFPVVYIMDANERVTPPPQGGAGGGPGGGAPHVLRGHDPGQKPCIQKRAGLRNGPRFIDEYLYPDGAPPRISAGTRRTEL